MASPLTVRPAVVDDARAIAEIHVRTWQTAYPGIVPADYLAELSIDKHEAMWRESILKGAPHLLVALADDRLAGWVAFGATRDPGRASDVAEIWAIYVGTEQWRRGVGRALWERARALLRDQGFRDVGVWAFPENERACRFYRSLGFELEPSSAQQFTLGGATLSEVRYACAIEARARLVP